MNHDLGGITFNTRVNVPCQIPMACSLKLGAETATGKADVAPLSSWRPAITQTNVSHLYDF